MYSAAFMTPERLDVLVQFLWLHAKRIDAEVGQPGQEYWLRDPGQLGSVSGTSTVKVMFSRYHFAIQPTTDCAELRRQPRASERRRRIGRCQPMSQHQRQAREATEGRLTEISPGSTLDVCILCIIDVKSWCA